MSETKIITQKEKGLNRHWKNFIDKDYLGSHNLEKGEEMLLTIARVEGEELVKSVQKPDGESKTVLYFRENVPKMILNITNATTISNLYGTHPESWIEKKIQVYATQVKAFGKTQDALRIRDFIPQASKMAQVDVEKCRFVMDAVETVEELANVWKFKLSESERKHPDVLAHKDFIKSRLS